ncbi:Pleiotropic drug resistance protein 2 [Sesamum angolense]|uniref:Pleiotropic drug resistance protein 2 n=1 Tax=Sesamum angolense TaxID=2727404 RepID=A0AAE1XBV1_9LAMI|nr:Pleiotropic drug resistance protein 2 [Sesamum angolense]
MRRRWWPMIWSDDEQHSGAGKGQQESYRDVWQEKRHDTRRCLLRSSTAAGRMSIGILSRGPRSRDRPSCIRECITLEERWLRILVSDIVRPSRMTLLLGPPGSGKTTLLKALAGKPDDD